MTRCPICDARIYAYDMPPHRCLPRYLVWCPEHSDRDDAVAFYTYGPESACATWAERDDAQGDYDIVGGCPALVCVEDPEGVVTRWQVSGETVPEYTARRES